MSLVRRLRFEDASRLHRVGPQRDYRWTSSPKGDRVRVAFCDSSGRELGLSLRGGGSDYSVFLQIFDQRHHDQPQPMP